VVPPYDHLVSDPNFEGYRCVFAKKPFFTASAHLGAGLQKSSVFWHFLSSFAYHNLNGSASNKTVSTPPKLQQQRLRRQQWLRPLRLQRLNWLQQPLIGDKKWTNAPRQSQKTSPTSLPPMLRKEGQVLPFSVKNALFRQKIPKNATCKPTNGRFSAGSGHFQHPKIKPQKVSTLTRICLQKTLFPLTRKFLRFFSGVILTEMVPKTLNPQNLQ